MHIRNVGADQVDVGKPDRAVTETEGRKWAESKGFPYVSIVLHTASIPSLSQETNALMMLPQVLRNQCQKRR